MKKNKIFFIFNSIVFYAFTTMHLSMTMNGPFARSLFNKKLSSDVLRKKLETHLQDIQKVDPTIEVIKKIPEREKGGTCHNYIFSKIMNIEGRVPEMFKICGEIDYYLEDYIDILRYFEGTADPRPGDIIVYLSDNNWITHTGIIKEDGRIESKWGTTREIFLHTPWQVPLSYGKKFVCYRLKISGQELLKAVQNRLSEAHIAEKYRDEARKGQNQLFKHVASKKPTTNATVNKTYTLLETTMNIDVNVAKKNGKTALILAAIAGNIDYVHLLVYYKANVDHQDKSRNTALLYALKNKHFLIASFLIAYGAKQDIKNKQNRTAYSYYYDYYATYLYVLTYIMQNYAHKHKIQYLRKNEAI